MTKLPFLFLPLYFNTYKIAEQEEYIKLTIISNRNSNQEVQSTEP